MKKLNKKGFTLVELLAVIVVLALLMVVATSSIGGALNNSKKNALKTEAQKMLTSVYQEVKSEIMLDSSIYSGATPKYILKNDGTDYQGAFKIAENKIVDYCILYKNGNTTKFSIGKSGANITFDDSDTSTGFSIGNVSVKEGANVCTITETSGVVSAITIK